MNRRDPIIRDTRRVVACARQWLGSVDASGPKNRALRELGLLLCRSAASGSGGPKGIATGPLQLPHPADLVCATPRRLQGLGRKIILSRPGAWKASAEDRLQWTEVFGALGLSYAKAGDVSTVATLVRSAAYLGLMNAWLVESHEFLLNQQQPDGSIGLYARESTVLKDHMSTTEISLRVTVEALWSIAEFLGAFLTSPAARDSGRKKARGV